MMGTTLSPKLSLLCAICKIARFASPCDLELPPQAVESAKQIRCQSGTLVPKAKTLSVEKNSGIPPGVCSWMGCKFPQKCLAFTVRFGGVAIKPT